jgi:rod shape determining protein RodA
MQVQRHNTHILHLDKMMLFGLLLLAVIGLLTLYSAGGQDIEIVVRQGIRIIIGLILMTLLAQVRLQHVFYWVPWFYLGGVILLVAVLFIGDSSKGSQRWLDFGVFRFQPSEVMKLGVPMMVAWFLAEKPLPPGYGRSFMTLLIIVIPVLLIAKQPDLGTSLLIASSGMFVLFLAGIQWWIVIFCTTAGVSLVVTAIYMPWVIKQFMHDYQWKRVVTFLNPEADPLGAGYHIIQSKIAIGSGGIYGKGWLNGTQSHLEFLPERTTDFIFAVYSEEFGLLGVFVLLGVYAFILTRGLYMAIQAQGTFARLLAGSVILTFFVYLFVNMGMVTGVLPVVGLPLPLVSYGGSSVVTLMAGFGFLMAAHTHRRLLSG